MASSISDRRRLVARLVVLLALLMLGALQSPVRAAPDDTIPGWQWHMIANRDGVPPLVRSITQTPDGYIWLGSYYGIHRFDGARFQLLPPSSETPQQSSVIATLLATPDGNLWAGHDWGGLSVVRGDTHRMVSKPYLATVPLLRANAGGTAWAVASNGKQVNLARLIGGRWVIWAHTAMGYMTDAAVGRDGSLWFTVDDRLLVASPIDHGVTQVRPRIASPFTLTTDGAGQVWLVTRDSLRRLSPPSPTGEAVGPPIAKPASPKVGTVIFDGTSDIWAIEDDALLRRYHLEPGGHGLRMTGSWHSPYQISNPSYPLSQTPMLVDREHNLWIATSRGLLRFSHAAFTLALDAAASSVTWILPYGAVTDRRGTVWLWRKGDLFSVAPDGSLIAHCEVTREAGVSWNAVENHGMSAKAPENRHF